MNSGQFELAVVVGGRPIREYGSNGLTLVQGKIGQSFILRFRNNSASRVLAIPSIDGIGVVDGEKATENSRGYLVDAYSSAEFSGWRQSLEEVAQFVFSKKAGSYAASKGSPKAAGVIGVMVVAEKPEATKPVEIHHHHDHYHDRSYPVPYPVYPRPWYPRWPRPYRPWYDGPYWGETFCQSGPTYSLTGSASGTVHGHGMMRCASQPEVTASLNNAAPDLNLGTGWGQSEKSPVTEVTFNRGPVLAVLEVYYSDAAGLKKAGIDVTKKEKLVSAPVLPRAFSGFCQPPVDSGFAKK